MVRSFTLCHLDSVDSMDFSTHLARQEDRPWPHAALLAARALTVRTAPAKAAEANRPAPSARPATDPDPPAARRRGQSRLHVQAHDPSAARRTDRSRRAAQVPDPSAASRRDRSRRAAQGPDPRLAPRPAIVGPSAPIAPQAPAATLGLAPPRTPGPSRLAATPSPPSPIGSKKFSRTRASAPVGPARNSSSKAASRSTARSSASSAPKSSPAATRSPSMVNRSTTNARSISR